MSTAIIGLIAAGLGSIVTLIGTALRERWKYQHEDGRAERDALIELYKAQVTRLEAQIVRQQETHEAAVVRMEARHEQDREVLRAETIHWRQRAWDGLYKRAEVTGVASDAADVLETLVAEDHEHAD